MFRLQGWYIFSALHTGYNIATAVLQCKSTCTSLTMRPIPRSCPIVHKWYRPRDTATKFYEHPQLLAYMPAKLLARAAKFLSKNTLHYWWIFRLLFFYLGGRRVGVACKILFRIFKLVFFSYSGVPISFFSLG